MNSQQVAAALRILANAIEAPEGDAPATPAASSAEAPVRRGRGRPVKGEDTAPAAPAQALAAQQPDPFDTAVPTAPTATQDDVRAALKGLQAASSQDIAVGVLKTAGGVDNLSALPPEKYGAVVVAATAKQAEYTKAPAPATPDPFEVDVAAPAEKVLTIEDIKNAIVETQKRTSQDTVQKLVMGFGGKAPKPDGGGDGPSLKALPEAQFAAVIAALKALPATK